MRPSAIHLNLLSGLLLLGLATSAHPQREGIDYETQIQPVFTANCAISGCHTGESLPFGGLAGAGLVLTAGSSYEALVGKPSKLDPERSYVTPGRSSESILVLKLEGASETGSRMPLGGDPLAPEIIQLIKDWIDQGALRELPTLVETESW